jgi:hypothetical protein
MEMKRRILTTSNDVHVLGLQQRPSSLDRPPQSPSAWDKVCTLYRNHSDDVKLIFATAAGNNRGIDKGDVGIPVSELGKGFANLGVELDPKELMEWVNIIDSNSDNLVSMNEFILALFEHEARFRATQLDESSARSP